MVPALLKMLEDKIKSMRPDAEAAARKSGST
jgi:hypothetical protein